MTRMRPKPFHSIEKLKNATLDECFKTLEITVKPSDAQLQQVKITKTEKKRNNRAHDDAKTSKTPITIKPTISIVFGHEERTTGAFFVLET